MEIKKQLINSNKYSIKCPNTMKPLFLVVHNTYNDAPATNEINYMQSNNNQTSFHIAVDDKEAIQGIPLDRNAWHAGDGASGQGNRYGIGIEICYSLSGGNKFNLAEQNAAKVCAKLLKEYNWGIDKVKKHQDFSGKYCPHRTLDNGWNRFIDMVKNELNELNNPVTEGTTTFYRIICGSYTKKDNAETAKNKLGTLGYTGVFIEAKTVNGVLYYRVICGSYTNKLTATNIKARLDAQNVSGVFIEIYKK